MKKEGKELIPINKQQNGLKPISPEDVSILMREIAFFTERTDFPMEIDFDTSVEDSPQFAVSFGKSGLGIEYVKTHRVTNHIKITPKKEK